MAGKVRVLLVDDRPENLLSLEATLAADDYDLVKAGSGADALRYLLDNDCAIILLDVQMPEMDGFETADLIKANPKLKDIPIIFLTALNTDALYVSRGYRVGAVDYISKPIVPEYLVAKVAVFAALHRSREKIGEQAALLREHELTALRIEQERRLAELELVALRREQALHRRYRDLVEGAPDVVVWVAQPTSLVLSFASPSAAIVTGYNLDLGKDLATKLVHDEDREMFEERLAALRPDEPTTVEHRVLRKDGELVWLSSTVRLEKKLDGGGDELRGFTVDVTEQKLVERTLRLLAQVSDEVGASLDVNEIARRLAQVCVPDVGDGCSVVVAPDAGDMLPMASAQAWDTPEQAHVAQRLLDHAAHASSAFNIERAPTVVRIGEGPTVDAGTPDSDEHERLVRELGAHSYLSVPLMLSVPAGAPSSEQRTVGAISLWSCNSSRPMDERAMLLVAEIARRASQALDNASLYRKEQEAVAHRDEFLSVASHELRTPLAPLKIGLQSSLAKLTKEPDKAPSVTVMKSLLVAERQVDRLQLLVDTLLDVSRIRAGRLELERGRMELHALVRDVVARFQPELDRKSVRVIQRLEPIAGTWDKSRLDQVISNLITNAIKYGEGRPIEVELRAVRPDGDGKGNGNGSNGRPRARLMIADKGIGISEKDTERIFNRFERASPSQSYGGLGLGLYITRQIVRAHGGDVRVETTLGEGSRFYVELPVEA